MEMTPGEIVSNYNQARNKSEQVEILAQLNACKPEDIIDILRTNGVDGKSLPRGKYAKSTKTSDGDKCAPHTARRAAKSRTTTEVCEPKPVTNSDCMAYIQSLHKRRTELKNEMKLIDAELMTFQRAAAFPNEGGQQI